MAFRLIVTHPVVHITTVLPPVGHQALITTHGGQFSPLSIDWAPIILWFLVVV